MSTNQTDPIVIGFEQAQAAVLVLGITDLDHVKEVRVAADKVTVVRYCLENGKRLYVCDGWVTTSSTIPVIVDEDTEAALAEQDRPKPRLNHMSSDVYLDSIEYEDSALDEMEAQQ